MALKILIVDPDREWLESAATHFEDELYEVDIAFNGKDAQLALYNHKYFAVILNLEVKNHAGAQVLAYIKSNHSSQKVVLVLENDEPIRSGAFTIEKFKKMGATEIISKPFGMDDLSGVLSTHQSLGDLMNGLPKKDGASEEVEVTGADVEFSKIRIEEFYSSQSVLFDIFIRLSKDRYIKILHAGDKFSKERIDKYKNEKQLEFLYFYAKDRRKYVQFSSYLTKKIVANKNVSSTQKVNMLKNVSAKFIEETYAEGLKPQVVDQGKEICETVYEVIDKESNLYNVLREFQDFDPNAFTHSYLVTLFASAIIKQFEWQSKATIETTALACMFHDIGKTKLPPELFNMRPGKMSDEQLEQYKKHPELGVKIVEENRMLNHSIKQIILQHHEKYDGTGFPYGLKGNKILTLANIVSLADDFVRVIGDDKIKPVEALRKLLSTPKQTEKYNSLILENFIKVFVAPPVSPKATVLPSNSRLVPNRRD